MHILEECVAPAVILKFEGTSLRQFVEEVAYTHQSHVIPIKIVAQRAIGVGGPQVQVD